MALRAYLQAKNVGPGSTVLLPAYIGWSAREGSGVLDPIQSLGATAQFYRVTRNLAIDVDDLRRRLNKYAPSVLMLIHYFGWPDDNATEIAAMVAAAGVPLVEDAAHAWLSDAVGGSCGRLGEATIYSTHKLLPCTDGGELIANSTFPPNEFRRAFAASDPTRRSPRLDYDVTAIADRRIANANALIALLDDFDGASLLHRQIGPGIVPQTLPIVISRGSRDAVYFALNGAGFGGTSLYHTLVADITESDFPDSHWLARRIFNLPVHQDASMGDLVKMVHALAKIIGG